LFSFSFFFFISSCFLFAADGWKLVWEGKAAVHLIPPALLPLVPSLWPQEGRRGGRGRPLASASGYLPQPQAEGMLRNMFSAAAGCLDGCAAAAENDPCHQPLAAPDMVCVEERAKRKRKNKKIKKNK
jgi:hypothetical protein